MTDSSIASWPRAKCFYRFGESHSAAAAASAGFLVGQHPRDNRIVVKARSRPPKDRLHFYQRTSFVNSDAAGIDATLSKLRDRFEYQT